MRSLAVLAAALTCVAPDAWAQTGSVRTYQGLFGGAGADAASARRSVNLSVSLIEVYDDNLRADVTSVSPTAGRASGFYTALTPNLDVASRGRTVRVSATMDSNLRYYPEQNRLISIGHSVAGTVAATLARRTTLSLGQSFSYSPSFPQLHGLFATVAQVDGGGTPGDPAVDSAVNPATDSAVNATTAASSGSYTYGATAGLSRAVSQRGTLSLNSGFRYTDLGYAPGGFSILRSYDVGGRFSRRVSRDGTLRLGYTYRQAVYSRTNRPETHDIDLGVDFLWPLTRTRRTTLGISVGSTAVSGPQPGSVSGSGESRTQYRALGDASLTHQFGRSWRLLAVYHRGLAFVPGLTGPVSTSATTVTTDGFLNRRTDVLVSAAYSTGGSPLAGQASSFKTYTGSVRVRVALTRRWATYGEYLYYLYAFNRTVELPPGVSPHLRRNSARIGLSLWLPVLRRA